MIERLCIIGVGLIGGSLARALREAKRVEHIVGCGRGRENLDEAVALGVIDEYKFDPAAAVVDADVVVAATNLGATRAVLDAIAPALRADAIVTDVGSAKTAVVASARTALGDAFARFVPGHPIAGTERSGVAASFASLFRDHRVILTPLADTDRAATECVAQMWAWTGARVSEMTPEYHDEMLAATSHLPHMLAYALVDCLAGMEANEDIFSFAAGGFRDFSRIASSSPSMWADIAIDNRTALLDVLARYEATFSRLRGALERSDRAALHGIFEHAKTVRDRVVNPDSK